jgi:hypothetical protein
MQNRTKTRRLLPRALLTAVLGASILLGASYQPIAATVRQCDWTALLSRLSGSDSRSIKEAALMVNDGMGSLAWVRLQGGSDRPPNTILTLRQVSAYLLLEVAREVGLTRSCNCSVGKPSPVDGSPRQRLT